MISRLILVFALLAAAVSAQTPVPDLKTNIDRLAAFDYPVRMNAARGDTAAATTLVTLATTGSPAVRRDATLAFAGFALRRAPFTIDWLVRAPGDVQGSAIDVLHEGFDSLEEDFTEEQFFATTRAAYWKAIDGSPDRTLMATLIDRLEF